MPFETIHKHPEAFRVPPNLSSYEEDRANSWEHARSGLDGLPGGGLNIAYEAVDRHAIGPQADKVALRTLDERGHATGLSYAELCRQTHYVSGRYALDLHSDDIYWCTADPGWVTGTSYGIIAPLTDGLTMIVDLGEFDARRWYRTLAEHGVTVWYTAPTALRMLS